VAGGEDQEKNPGVSRADVIVERLWSLPLRSSFTACALPQRPPSRLVGSERPAALEGIDRAVLVGQADVVLHKVIRNLADPSI
jgi:hypothetical protein